MPAKKDLTGKRRLFAYAYVQNGGNGTQAALEAGYGPKGAHVTACNLLKEPKIRAFIEALQTKIEQRHEITIDRVVQELRSILLVDPIHAFAEDGTVKPLGEWPEELRRALSGMETEERMELSDPENAIQVTIRKFKWWSKVDAAQQLLRRLGGFKLDNEQKAATLSELLAESYRRRLVAGGQT